MNPLLASVLAAGELICDLRPHLRLGRPAHQVRAEAGCENDRMGTGTGDMIERCKNVGLAEPEFSLTDGFVITIRRKPGRAFEAVGGQVAGEVAGPVAREVTGEVKELVSVCRDAMTRRNLQVSLSLRGEEDFRKLYLVPALDAGYIEMTIPDKPNSRLQKYRLTAKGKALLATIAQKEGRASAATPPQLTSTYLSSPTTWTMRTCLKRCNPPRRSSGAPSIPPSSGPPTGAGSARQALLSW